jgi:hypothetical protein
MVVSGISVVAQTVPALAPSVDHCTALLEVAQDSLIVSTRASIAVLSDHCARVVKAMANVALLRAGSPSSASPASAAPKTEADAAAGKVEKLLAGFLLAVRRHSGRNAVRQVLAHTPASQSIVACQKELAHFAQVKKKIHLPPFFSFFL